MSGIRKAVRQSRIGDHLMSKQPVRSAIFVLRACRIAEHPWQALRDQFTGPEVTQVKVKRTGQSVFLRRRSGDLVPFHQVIGMEQYRPPDAVMDSLRKLGRSPRIADLGANVGLYSCSALEYFPNAEILAIEADHLNAEIFEKTIAANDWGNQIELIQAAAGVASEPVRFTSGEFFLSRVEAEESADGDVIDGIDVLPMLSGMDLIKIDIEGSEWPIIQDPRFASIDCQAVVMEWHQYGCPDPDARAFAEATLKNAGFEVEHDEWFDESAGNLWGVRP